MGPPRAQQEQGLQDRIKALPGERLQEGRAQVSTFLFILHLMHSFSVYKDFERLL